MEGLAEQDLGYGVQREELWDRGATGSDMAASDTKGKDGNDTCGKITSEKKSGVKKEGTSATEEKGSAQGVGVSLQTRGVTAV